MSVKELEKASFKIKDLSNDELYVLLYSYLQYEWGGGDNDFVLDRLDAIDAKLGVNTTNINNFNFE